MAAKPVHRPTFIRQWRNHRGYSLDKLAEMVPMDKSNLSKVERGMLPYNQEMLERLADALMTDPASLLMRDPTSPAQSGLYGIERPQVNGSRSKPLRKP